MSPIKDTLYRNSRLNELDSLLFGLGPQINNERRSLSGLLTTTWWPVPAGCSLSDSFFLPRGCGRRHLFRLNGLKRVRDQVVCQRQLLVQTIFPKFFLILRIGGPGIQIHVLAVVHSSILR